MASEYSYFLSALNDERLLHDHGFDHWPTDEELARYLMDTNDRISAVERALGISSVKDVRGRWSVIESGEAVVA